MIYRYHVTAKRVWREVRLTPCDMFREAVGYYVARNSETVTRQSHVEVYMDWGKR